MKTFKSLSLLFACMYLTPLAHAGFDALTPGAGVPVAYAKFAFENSKIQTFVALPSDPIVSQQPSGAALELECVEAEVDQPVWLKDGVALVASKRLLIKGRKLQIPYLAQGLDDGVYTVSGMSIRPLKLIVGASAEANHNKDLLNSSSRGVVRLAGDQVTQGFVVGGETERVVMVRAIGPALAGFGVKNPLPYPKLLVYDSAGKVLYDSSGPQAAVLRTEVLALARSLGAFEIPVVSKDQIVACRVRPGNYTAVATSQDGQAGDVLVEVYITP